MTSLSVDKTLRRARAHEQKGESGEARALYQSVLDAFPGNKKAQQALARLGGAGPAGDPPAEIVEPLIALYNQGRFAEVAEQAAQLLRQYPDAFVLWNLSGAAAAQRGDLEQAEAAFRRAVALNGGIADAHGNLGNILNNRGKVDEAAACYRRAVELDPENPELYFYLGVVSQTRGAQDEAITCYLRSLEIAPGNAEVCNNLGTAYQAQGDIDQAIAAYRQAIDAVPEHASAQNNLGTVLQTKGRLEEAAECYERALSIRSEYPEALNNLGVVRNNMGDRDAAATLFKRAIALHPGYAEAHRQLSEVIKYTADDDHLARMRAFHRSPDIAEPDKCLLCFALAKASGDIGDPAASVAYLKEGNAIRKARLGYDIEQDRRLFASIKSAAPGFSGGRLDPPAAGLLPIFILGMPRSGTTLAEQIISSHSDVEGGGELRYAGRYGEALITGKEHPAEENIRAFREKYLADLAEISNGKRYVTDKMPQNFRQIGLLRAAFPDAKIVHIRRDPAAVCWSNFSHYFSSNGLGYSYDLADVVAYYRLYEDLMAFWARDYGGEIYDLDYELLTQNPEEETRRLIDWLGIGWQDSCLSPHKNTRGVTTNSQLQVRQAIYTGSSAAWKKFEPWLDGAFDGLAR